MHLRWTIPTVAESGKSALTGKRAGISLVAQVGSLFWAA